MPQRLLAPVAFWINIAAGPVDKNSCCTHCGAVSWQSCPHTRLLPPCSSSLPQRNTARCQNPLPAKLPPALWEGDDEGIFLEKQGLDSGLPPEGAASSAVGTRGAVSKPSAPLPRPQEGLGNWERRVTKGSKAGRGRSCTPRSSAWKRAGRGGREQPTMELERRRSLMRKAVAPLKYNQGRLVLFVTQDSAGNANIFNRRKIILNNLCNINPS